ncbi:MAG: enoyl-CoA hydratase/isomerase family protein [Actinomycetes bacterium]
MSDLQVDHGPYGALRIRFDAPARRNALTLETVQHLHQVLADTPEQALLLGSTTDGIFSAGADLDTDGSSRAQLSDLLYACYEQLVTRPGVVLAVVQGPAVGGGAQLSTAADIRLISQAARWRWTGPGHGLAVGAWILPDLVGRSRGLQLALTSRWLDAAEAVAIGLAARIDTAPWKQAEDLVRRLADADADALARIKRVASAPHVLARLALERSTNRELWSGSAPTAHRAAADGRDLPAIT